jgi:hypothetical protein
MCVALWEKAVWQMGRRVVLLFDWCGIDELSTFNVVGIVENRKRLALQPFLIETCYEWNRTTVITLIYEIFQLHYTF